MNTQRAATQDRSVASAIEKRNMSMKAIDEMRKKALHTNGRLLVTLVLLDRARKTLVSSPR